jgi:uroporphyrinogen-III synthase
MQEAPLDDNESVFRFTEQLLAGEFDAVIFLTGVGAQALMEVSQRRFDGLDILNALRKTRVVIRGPKPAAVMRKWDVPVTVAAPEPNTWKEIVTAMEDGAIPFPGQRFAVQEYGQPSEELYAALQARGATVTPVPVYRWTLPDDTGPLEAAITRATENGFDLFLFTSAQQIRHVLQVADRLGLKDAWLSAVKLAVVGSIGPTCSDALRDADLCVDLEPTHPKMGTLVRECCSAAGHILPGKRSS